ncbi:cytospin-A isoform X1 [Nilaparvata lugens]|uniref:cytospin-A isoform X1 n=1 Tax=Nilaparvata lugens TaxID=108931 RepID=UPI00193DABCF|nr:cytospin-A isoform X1 [Nilaparvata lugens]
MQMEETHHSTNEELQATLQELADLQTQLTELQTDNERLGEEKGVLLESLCRQTERLEDARTKVDTLQGLLLDSSPGCPASNSEREQKLVELLKSGQDERETLLLKQEELSNELSEQRRTCEALRQEASRLTERVELLESTIDATHAERNQLDLQLAQAKEESSSRQIEISRLNTLLENARAKIEELEASRDKLHDRSEMDELLHNARKEKDVLEGQAASLQEQLSRSRCEVARLKEQISVLQEECKVTRNNAKSALSDLEYECQRSREECARLASDLQALQETSCELQVQTQCHLDDKRQLQSVLTETQKHLGECARTLASTEKQLADEKRLRNRENEEWEQFQSDLLMTVRVANEFKTEAQHELEKLVLENKLLRDNIRNLDAQIEKLKQAAEKQEMVMPENNSTNGPCVQEMCRRHKISRQERDSRLSVKSLIESIENATKQAKTGPGVSRSSSTSSLNSIASLTGLAVNQAISSCQQPVSSPTSPIREGDMKALLPLRDRDQQLTTNKQPLKWTLLSDPLEPVKGNNKVATISEDTTSSILNSRSIEFARKNSSGDLCERKDPLSALSKNGGSKRNALLKWCQNKTLGYKGIDITNFSSSWNDGLALCAILHSYLPDRVPYETLSPSEKRRNFTIAFAAAESVGIPTALSMTDMILQERPDWQQVMAYVTNIYKHFET